MLTAKRLRAQLRKVQKELTIPHISLDALEKLNVETKRAFEDSIKYLAERRDMLKKIDVHRDYLKLWHHNGKRIVLPINWRYILSAPFIYGMVAPALVWNVGLEIYHQVCFRLYGIPLVKAKEYFIYDRQLLSYLNWWEKINCYYCSYVNNLIRYSSEIGGRTERYWCPIKYARRMNNTHSQYAKFINIESQEQFREEWSKLRDFSDMATDEVKEVKN